MQHFRPLLTLIILLVILIIIIAIAGKRAEAPIVDDSNATTTATEPGAFPDATTGIAVTDNFKNGTHTYTFDVYIPTPCHRLSEPGVMIRESFPEQIAIEYEVLPPPPDVMCAQVITRVPVSVVAQASEQAVLSSIRLNGNSIAFSVISKTR